MDNQLQLTVNVIATDRSIYMIENGRLNARFPRKSITCLEMNFDASDRPTENTSRIGHAIRVKKAVYRDSLRYHLLRNDRRRTPGTPLYS